MWIQIALSISLLLVALRAVQPVLDCKAIDLLSTSNVRDRRVLPMDACTTITHSSGFMGNYSYWYHCDDSGNAMISSYWAENCEGNASTVEVSNSSLYSTFTVTAAYCEKSACEVVNRVTMSRVTMKIISGYSTAKTSIISGYCTGELSTSTSTKYTCVGDNVLVETYSTAIDCSGTSSVQTFSAGVIDCKTESIGANATITTATTYTCGTASLTVPSSIVMDAPCQPGAIVTGAPSTSDGTVTDTPSQTVTSAPTTSNSSRAVTIPIFSIFVFIVTGLYPVM